MSDNVKKVETRNIGRNPGLHDVGEFNKLFRALEIYHKRYIRQPKCQPS